MRQSGGRGMIVLVSGWGGFELARDGEGEWVHVTLPLSVGT